MTVWISHTLASDLDEIPQEGTDVPFCYDDCGRIRTA